MIDEIEEVIHIKIHKEEEEIKLIFLNKLAREFNFEEKAEWLEKYNLNPPVSVSEKGFDVSKQSDLSYGKSSFTSLQPSLSSSISKLFGIPSPSVS